MRRKLRRKNKNGCPKNNFEIVTLKCSPFVKEIYKRIWTKEDDEFIPATKGHHPYHPAVGRALVELCKEKLLTIHKLAEEMGYSPESIRRDFKRFPEYKRYYKVAMKYRALHKQDKVLKGMSRKARRIAKKYWKEEWNTCPPCDPDMDHTYHPIYALILPDLFKNGESQTEVCAHLGIIIDVFCKWRDEREDFQEQFARAQVLCEAWWQKHGRLGCAGEIKANAQLFKFFMFNRYGWTNDVGHSKIVESDEPAKPIDIRVRVLTEEEAEKIRQERKAQQMP